jgi:membrane protein DedA with SNARE-associated domain
MDAAIHEFLTGYGLIAVAVLLLLSGVGLALGEEMVTIPAGIFVAAGEMQFIPVAVVAYCSIVIADLTWFSICRHYGMPLLHRRGLRRLVHPRRLLEVKHQFERRGIGIVIMSRFVPSSRTTTITVAGIMDMRFVPFLTATAGCVLITVPLQLGLGYLVGLGLGDQSLAELSLKVLGLLALLLAVFVVLNIWMKHRIGRQRAPRARASWLRRFRKGSRSSVPTGR